MSERAERAAFNRACCPSLGRQWPPPPPSRCVCFSPGASSRARACQQDGKRGDGGRWLAGWLQLDSRALSKCDQLQITLLDLIFIPK
jgi:hypothetical protein